MTDDIGSSEMRGICLRATCSFASPGIRTIRDLWGDERLLELGLGSVGEDGLNRGVGVTGDEERREALRPKDDLRSGSVVDVSWATVVVAHGCCKEG